ncbi:hypothetical protein D5872_18925 [Salmonella enterica subsp. enterica serovar Birkenhead]|nr:hypothetical protein [Salmonella enterica]EBV7176687.1 hypothetical protein [Salmonella enterica subsp. enterica serovar Thompson]EBY7194489.1 hypothetical protein [Salmonella enterica subsp. enterica serovar Birkenhead]EDZ5420633.1 hypothetical protein [Salmonella enterica subsp. enterica serovar Muenchen]EAY2195387.1 hypothetical protein [Salmonella enterica]
MSLIHTFLISLQICLFFYVFPLRISLFCSLFVAEDTQSILMRHCGHQVYKYVIFSLPFSMLLK